MERVAVEPARTENGLRMPEPRPLARELVAALLSRGLTIAVAESLTGGLLASAIVDVPGASAVFRGGVVAYDIGLKSSLLGVPAPLLAQEGAVHPLVAEYMASGIRSLLSVDGRAVDIGISTTGVAGPGPQDGHAPGTAFIGVSTGSRTYSVPSLASGGRPAIRDAVVREALSAALSALGSPPDRAI